MTTPRIDTETMAHFFTKYHLIGPWPFDAVLHRFTEADGGDPHDHPWSFRSVVLRGGYLEEVFDLSDGSSKLVYRHPGDSFRNEAGHVHRIIELLDGECWTIILPEPWERRTGFYQFREDGIYHRYFDEPEFSSYPRLELTGNG